MSERMIRVKNISKTYKGKIHALRDVSFEVEKGELFGLIGPDGAGKSTMYRILTTLLLPDKGEAEIGALSVERDFKEIRRKIGYMPERFSLYGDLTVKENLEFFATLFGVSVKDNYDLIAPVYEPQLSRFPTRKAGALSGGMKQKLALCCSLIHRPEILLLDEPTTGVDAVSRSEFWFMLKSLREKGITILVSTSYMDEAAMCDRIALINEGHILESDTPQRLVNGLGENLYAVSAEEMFRLLEKLRVYPDIEECYTFGASIHTVVKTGFSPEALRITLEREGLNNVKIARVGGNIEDLFIKLMKQ